MSQLSVRLEAIVPSGESHAETSLTGQTFPIQPSVPASLDRVGYMRFPVKSFSMDYDVAFSSFGYLYCFMSMPVSCVGGSLREHVCVHTHARGRCWLSSSTPCHFIHLKQDLSSNLRLAILGELDSQRDP